MSWRHAQDGVELVGDRLGRQAVRSRDDPFLHRATERATEHVVKQGMEEAWDYATEPSGGYGNDAEGGFPLLEIVGITVIAIMAVGILGLAAKLLWYLRWVLALVALVAFFFFMR